MLSRCLLTKFLHWSSVRGLSRVRCWLGDNKKFSQPERGRGRKVLQDGEKRRERERERERSVVDKDHSSYLPKKNNKRRDILWPATLNIETTFLSSPLSIRDWIDGFLENQIADAIVPFFLFFLLLLLFSCPSSSLVVIYSCQQGLERDGKGRKE